MPTTFLQKRHRVKQIACCCNHLLHTTHSTSQGQARRVTRQQLLSPSVTMIDSLDQITTLPPSFASLNPTRSKTSMMMLRDKGGVTLCCLSSLPERFDGIPPQAAASPRRWGVSDRPTAFPSLTNSACTSSLLSNAVFPLGVVVIPPQQPPNWPIIATICCNSVSILSVGQSQSPPVTPNDVKNPSVVELFDLFAESFCSLRKRESLDPWKLVRICAYPGVTFCIQR